MGFFRIRFALRTGVFRLDARRGAGAGGARKVRWRALVRVILKARQS